MPSWFHGLQFRLVLGFATVLALALGGVSFYVGFAAQRETERFQQQVEETRAARIERIVARHYRRTQGWSGLQPVLEEAGSLYGWRVTVTDRQGRTVADSEAVVGATDVPDRPTRGKRRSRRALPIVSDREEVGSLSFSPTGRLNAPAEPPASSLVAALNRSLLWTGLAAGGGAVLLVSMVSRQVLDPMRTLGSAASRLGLGDLSQRVSASGRGEVAQLAQTFNSMAEGLERAEAQRRSLMADVAHELRTPLSNIQGYLEAIRDGLLQPDATTIDVIHQQVMHLNRLVEDLRLLALAEAGVLRLDLRPESLGDLLQASVEAVRPRAEAKGVEVTVELPPDILLLEMDRTRLAQVLGNLLENAILHTPGGGVVTVWAELRGARVRVSVSDTGEGIPPDELDDVFDRFYRVDRSRSRATGGAGLGLTIARQFVQAHGGAIWAESALGAGTSFIFELPLRRSDMGVETATGNTQ